MTGPGRIVILNGAPRSGKSSIVAAIQEAFEGCWMNLGVDVHAGSMTPPRLRPGIGLRPGGEAAVAPLVPTLYAALYESIAAHSRLGLNVVSDLGHHGAEPASLACLTDGARRLAGLPVLFVGVRCPIEVIMQRRRADQARGDTRYISAAAGEPVPEPVARWQAEAHEPGVYDLEVDTSRLSPAACAEAIARRLAEIAASPTAFERLAALAG